MDITKKIGPWREVGKRLLVITIYSIIMALNYKSFVQAGDLFPGGFTGLTRLAQRCAQEFWGVTLPFAPINLVLNAIPAAVSLSSSASGSPCTPAWPLWSAVFSPTWFPRCR